MTEASVDTVTDTHMILRHKNNIPLVRSTNIPCFQNPEEWKYVERLISQAKPRSTPVPEVRTCDNRDNSDNVEPQVADHTPTSSGFVMPTAKPGDHPYHVKVRIILASSWSKQIT